MLDTDWSDSWRGAFRIELRAEAIGLAWHGWPVLPGTSPAADSGDEAWSGPVPVHHDWADRLGAHPNEVAEWWNGHPYSLLVATGKVVDAVEVDVELGKRAARLLRATGHPAPIVATPDGRWLFLTTVADTLPERLATSGEVRWHGVGSWVPLPPTPFQHGVVHWRVKPDVWGWRLPEADAVHAVLARALDQADSLERAQQLVVASVAA
ncbi:bifunctional DNA primase/polymerase [Amycolatopsis acidiphila]|uniref:DNA primase n=1 Tax=Amycolatopsis acidiphila TaxID=715473 RepID=A0A557ZXL1_9PSEU|nr:bifunctional DNA primase/polymerase [Amycolatopsis acidiphila]TVT16751.1 DNA primase [Amycolatopsis acidiphila]UIJ59470.1 bifunctional DNA primase/polymerase [Amycolatopsis acidiphila]GHG94692.1 DNA primase [Amycolatopsis acidiphila]